MTWTDHPPRALLSVFMDGECSYANADAVRCHLVRCSQCAAALADMMALETAMTRATKRPWWRRLVAWFSGAWRRAGHPSRAP